MKNFKPISFLRLVKNKIIVKRDIAQCIGQINKYVLHGNHFFVWHNNFNWDSNLLRVRLFL